MLASVGGLVGCSALGADDNTASSATTTTTVLAGTPADQAVEAGLAKHVKGDLAGATADYQDALKSDPKNVLALYNLGMIAQTEQNNQDADARYQEVLKIDVNYQPALFNLAILRKAAGETAEAERLYRRAIESKPEDAGAHFNLGLLLRETDRKELGDAEIATAVRLNPKLVDPTTVTTAKG